ncbi:MAG: hypothetical protein J6Q82_02830 [Clostridia bacterium]|nr:hypothetical protein [Clostridia bacterium]
MKVQVLLPAPNKKTVRKSVPFFCLVRTKLRRSFPPQAKFSNSEKQSSGGQRLQSKLAVEQSETWFTVLLPASKKTVFERSFFVLNQKQALLFHKMKILQNKTIKS